MSKKLIFGIIATIFIIIIGFIFGISTIVKFWRLQSIINDVTADILKENFYIKITAKYDNQIVETETFYRDGVGKLKNSENSYTWTDGEKAYLINENEKQMKTLDIEKNIQLLVTRARLASLYPTISNNIFERFFIMGNMKNKIKTVEEDGKKYTYIEIKNENFIKSYWLERDTNVLKKSKLELINGEKYEYEYEIKFHSTKLSDLELPNLDDYKEIEDSETEILEEKEFVIENTNENTSRN